MVVFSKTSIPFSCYEVGHTWTPFCENAAAGVGLSCFEEGIKIYSSVYLLSTLLSGKFPDLCQLKRLLYAILRSSLFLGCNGFCFISAFCLCRKMLGSFGILSSGFLPSFLANFVSILVERKSRRPALAIYVSNVASETLFNQLVDRGLLKPVKNGDIILFSITLACLFRWCHTTQNRSNFLYKLASALLGDTGQLRTNYQTRTGVDNTTQKTSLLDIRHTQCSHTSGCFRHICHAFFKTFLISWGLHSSVATLLSLPSLLRKPANLWILLRNERHLRFGAFLASLATISKATRCILLWVHGSNSSNTSALAGLLAGLSITFYRNTTLILYLAWKTVEVLYHEGVESGWLREIPEFATFLYSFSTSILFHAAVLEPHNLKPAYWRFLTRITGNRIAELNRKALDVLGTQSSKMLPKFNPLYSSENVSDEFKVWLGSHTLC